MRTMTKLLTGFLACVVALVIAGGQAFAADAPIDNKLDQYWGKRRAVKVIQKRLFLRDGRHEFTLFGGTIPNNDFLIYIPMGLRYDYYLSEDLAVELNGAYNVVDIDSGLEGYIQEKHQIPSSQKQMITWYANLNGTWSPLHGKLSFFTTKLAHFDLNVTFGAGVIATDVTQDDGSIESKFDIAGNVGLGFRVYVNDWIALRLDYRNFFYGADKINGGGLSYPVELTLGVSFFTPMPK